MAQYSRLRHVCLATENLREAVEILRECVGLEPCFRDEDVLQFGLENVLYHLDGSYLEIVAPVTGSASLWRFLQRGDARGAYLVGFDHNDREAARQRASSLGVRVIFETDRLNGGGFQMHPADVGGVILEIDHHVGDQDRHGPYAWAEPIEKYSDRVPNSVALTGISVTSQNAKQLAALWAALLDVETIGTGPESTLLGLDYGTTNFVGTKQGNTPGVDSLTLCVSNPATFLAAFEAAGLPQQDNRVQFCGVNLILKARGK